MYIFSFFLPCISLWSGNNVMRLFSSLYIAASHTCKFFPCISLVLYMYVIYLHDINCPADTSQIRHVSVVLLMQVKSNLYPLSPWCKLDPTCISCPACISYSAEASLIRHVSVVQHASVSRLMQVRSDMYPLSTWCKLYPTCISCPACISCPSDAG